MDKNAARFTKRLTDKERDTLIRAVVLDGLTVADAIRRAAAGQLGIPAFTIGSSAYGLIRDHRAEYEARDPARRDQAIDEELERLVALALTRSRKLAETSTPEDIARNAKALAGIKRAAREASTRTKPTPPNAKTPDDTDTQRETTNTVTDLLELVTTSARSGSLNHAAKPPHAA